MLYGMGGIGKSTLAAQIAARVDRLRSGRAAAVFTGEVSAATFAAGPAEADFIIWDNFDDNLSENAGQWTVRDPALAASLAAWPGKLLITCHNPFTLVPQVATGLAVPPQTGGTPIPLAELAGNPAERLGLAAPRLPRPGRERLVFRRVGPLTRSGASELTAALPGLRLLVDSERDQAWRLTGGHPLAIEYLDALLTLGERYADVVRRVQARIQATTGQPLPRTEPTELPEATAELIASAAADQMCGDLFDRLSAGARNLLVRTSVFRVPVAPDVVAGRPGQIAECQAVGLLCVESGHQLSVHRWTADALQRRLAEAGLGAQVLTAHRQAAGYWRSRAANAPAGRRPELEARFHQRCTRPAGPSDPSEGLEPTPAPTTARRHLVRLGVAAAFVALTAVLAVEATYGFPGSHLASADAHTHATTSAPVTQAVAARTQAALWAAEQVGDDAILACDPAMCSVLVRRGISAGNLLVLGPGTADPLSSDVILATAAVRGTFGSRLSSVYAPEILASFGSGQARIDIRVVASAGAAAYRLALAADLLARQAAGQQLLHDPRIAFASSARAQLIAGQVDARLLTTLDTMAADEPVRIETFLDGGPGASPGLPLRAAEVIGARGAVRHMLAFFRAQRAPYVPARTAVTVPTGSGGQSVLTVQFAAPTPLGLLQPQP
ncbi:MAG: hypothetical protein M3Z75_23805 [Actinomycetota bacterium]|nr:hypothetical protein [Actinomycetota bacterium]